jgi:hypothetical protein
MNIFFTILRSTTYMAKKETVMFDTSTPIYVHWTERTRCRIIHLIISLEQMLEFNHRFMRLNSPPPFPNVKV